MRVSYAMFIMALVASVRSDTLDLRGSDVMSLVYGGCAVVLAVVGGILLAKDQ